MSGLDSGSVEFWRDDDFTAAMREATEEGALIAFDLGDGEIRYGIVTESHAEGYDTTLTVLADPFNKD